MAIDKVSTLYAFGDNKRGCLGFIDGKKRCQPQQIPFFYCKRVIDVACGENFTVVIAEVEGDPNAITKQSYVDDPLKLIKKAEIKSTLVFD